MQNYEVMEYNFPAHQLPNILYRLGFPLDICIAAAIAVLEG